MSDSARPELTAGTVRREGGAGCQAAACLSTGAAEMLYRNPA